MILSVDNGPAHIINTAVAGQAYEKLSLLERLYSTTDTFACNYKKALEGNNTDDGERDETILIKFAGKVELYFRKKTVFLTEKNPMILSAGSCWS